MKIGFDNDKYLKMQSEHIKERIAKFDNKLYLEFGGKLFDDYHASRVLPGFKPDSKLQMLLQLKDQAEVVIAAVGRAEMVTGDFISEGAVVIDVGINVNAEGKLCGDVKFDECVDKASMITPVPAGVGSVTTSVLAKHVVKACKQINNIQ